MAGRLSNLRERLVGLALCLVLLAPCISVAERNVDSALRKAAQAGDLAEMQHQLELGAEPNQAYALVAAVQANQLEAVKYLLTHGADPNAWTRLNLRVPLGAGESPMYVAASRGNREILRYLKNHGADVNAEWGYGGASETALSASVLSGDLQAVQLLLEYGADVNHVPRHGDMPLMQTASAVKNNVELAQLLLRHGADADLKNSDGLTVRQQSRQNLRLRSLIEQAQPATAAQLAQEDILEVAMGLHYKALCDAALPGYQTRVATDYGRWRIAQKTAISQLESSADFRNQQADAKAAFEQATAQAAQAGGDELKQQMQMLQHICEVSLVEQFRFGTPVSEANPRGASAAVELIRPAAATVQTGSVTVHKTTAPTAGGMLSHP